jgi:hypothetical protein
MTPAARAAGFFALQAGLCRATKRRVGAALEAT